MSRTTGFAPATQIVPTAFLRDVIKPLIDALDEQLAAESDVQRCDRNGTQRHGAYNLVAERAALSLNWNPEQPRVDPTSLPRRLYDIIRGRSGRTSLDHADAFLIALGQELATSDIPVFPNSIAAAYEMIDAHLWIKEETMPEPEKRELARLLHKFTHGFLRGCQFDVEELIAAANGDPDAGRSCNPQDRKRRAKREKERRAAKRAELAEMRRKRGVEDKYGLKETA